MCWNSSLAQPQPSPNQPFTSLWIRRPSLASPHLRVPWLPPAQCSHLTNVGKLRPKEEALFAHTMPPISGWGGHPGLCSLAVSPQASCLPSLGLGFSIEERVWGCPYLVGFGLQGEARR